MNKYQLKIACIFVIFCVSFVATADVRSRYLFISPLQEQRFIHLISELRCLVCQNQSLAESDALLAQDLKNQIYEQIRAGFSDQQIKNFLIQRYGEYILFKPALNRNTFVLWLGPVIFLMGSFCILIINIRRNQIKLSGR